jgi:hypothetical protein
LIKGLSKEKKMHIRSQREANLVHFYVPKLNTRYYPIRKVVYYQAIHRPARPGRPRAPACCERC